MQKALLFLRREAVTSVVHTCLSNSQYHGFEDFFLGNNLGATVSISNGALTLL